MPVLVILSLCLCTTVLQASQPADMMVPTSETILSRFVQAYKDLRPLEVSFQIADPMDADNPLLAYHPELAPLIDPDTQTPLWPVSSASLTADPSAHRYLLKRTQQIDDFAGSESPGDGVYQACTPTLFWQAEEGADSPAMISVAPDGETEDTETILRALRLGRSTGWLRGAQSEYFLALIFALWHLPNVQDLAVLEPPAPDSTVAVLASRSLGLECEIDTETGELLAVTFHAERTGRIRLEVVDFFPDSLFPARAPSLVRQEHQSGDIAGIHLLAYDSPPTLIPPPSPSVFDWQEYRKSAIDQARRVRINRDGSTTPWQSKPSPFAEQVRRRHGSSPHSETGEPPTLPLRRPPAHSLSAILLGLGITTIVIGVLLAWRRGR